jgi:hypothetical protein
LFKVFAYDCDIGEQRLVLDVPSDVESTLDVSKLDGCPCNAGEAFEVVLFDEWLGDAFEF